MGLFDFFNEGFAVWATALWAGIFGAIANVFAGFFGG